MDPLAHTLVGATLAQTRLKKLSPLAAPTLLIGANLPDIDAVMMLVGADASLAHRRGWTHGILALMVLPWLLTGLLLWFDKSVRRRRNPSAAPVKWRGVLLLSCIGVWTHPFLDWLNTYGVRLLMPFDGRWFYGDTLFIVDLWLWLLMAVAAVLAYSQSKTAQFFWALLAAATTYLVWATPEVSPVARYLWGLGLLGIVILRVFKKISPNRAAEVGLAALLAYLGIMFWGNDRAEQISRKLVPGSTVVEIMTGPLPAQLLGRQVLVVTDTEYHGFRVHWLSGKADRTFAPVERVRPDKVVQIALQDESIQGFVSWMRYPHYEVRPHELGHEVLVRDLRYVHPDHEGPAGIGSVTVLVPRSAVCSGEC